MRVYVHNEWTKIAKIEFKKRSKKTNTEIHTEKPYLSNGIGRDFVDAVDGKWSQSKYTRDTCEHI